MIKFREILLSRYLTLDKRGNVYIKKLPWIYLSPTIKESYLRHYLQNIKGIELAENVTFQGFPWILLAPGSRLVFGSDCTLVSDFYVNSAGINHPCIFSTMESKSIIKVGKGTGMSGATIVAAERVEIGEYVNVGVNCCIYDTDFHSIDPVERRITPPVNVLSSPVVIGDDVWLGANVIVLKGVKIGARSVIGAGSVVTHDIPPDCIAAGNPAKVVKRI